MDFQCCSAFYIYIFSLSVSQFHKYDSYLGRRGEMRLGCSFSSHLFAFSLASCNTGDLSVAPDPSGFVVQQQVHSDLDNLQAPLCHELG